MNDQRRLLLKALALQPLLALPMARAHEGFGPVQPPLPAPALALTDHHGQPRQLASWLPGRVWAVQTMFTACRAICPIQGALFAQVQQRLQAQRLPVQLLSLSIDPEGDSARTLSDWLARHKAGAGWQAALPDAPGVALLQGFLEGPEARQSAADRHSGQVYFFDAQARLCWRSSPLPRASEVLTVLQQLAA